MNKLLGKCELCPRKCKVNRNKGEIGFCRAKINPKIALINLHNFEEPCISGNKGSGTVFFSGCNLNCIYCQNYKISQKLTGKELTIEELSNEFLKLQKKGANNINLVTGFAFVPQIVEAIKIAKKNGLNIPIIYNTSGYESIETLKLLEGYVDVYLPDLKYYYDELGKKFSGVENYFEVATKAIKEMVRQVGTPKFDEKGIIKKGVIIRHLILPNHIQNSKMILKWIKQNINKDVFVSVMAQYFPTYKALQTDDLNRKLTEEEFNQIEEYIYKINLKNGYIQYLEENEEQYVPDFK
ncbi:MAG: radical SAM protein [Candidatus Scatovivens sp.]